MGNWTIKDHILGPEKQKVLFFDKPYECFMCFDTGFYWAKPEDLVDTVCKCWMGMLAGSFAKHSGTKKFLDNS